MPGMGGLEAIRQIMARRATPIVVLSAHARRGAELTLQALEAGAVEFVLKPDQSLSGGLDHVARELIEKVKSARAVRLPAPAPEACRPDSRAPRGPKSAAWRGPPGRYELVAIGTSTGGPVALKAVLERLPADFPLPVVVVQHMPPVFTRAFAERLDGCCPLWIKEAQEGDALLPGRVLIAPGGFHLSVSRFAGEPRVLLGRQEPVNGHRPSVDVLMGSVAREYGQRAIGLIMTGMGKDGAQGVGQLHGRGGHVIAQDGESSVIYGMNREVVEQGHADEVRPLPEIAASLMRLAVSGPAGNGPPVSPAA
jgi:two-component system chemotaxis response regulator CheB